MTTPKSVITAIAFCLLITSTAFAYNGPDNTSTALRAALSKMVQNPELAKHHIEEATVALEFTIDHTGAIQVLKVNSTSSYLSTYIKEQLNNQHLGAVNYIPGQKYVVRFRFELE